MRPLPFFLAVLAVLAFTSSFFCSAVTRSEDAPKPVAPSKPAVPSKPVFKPEEIDQLVAPIALYPDSLVSQILMASTYPLQVVEAARWVKASPSLKGDKLTAALEKNSWDPSVKSLVNFPPVLSMMDAKLDWTQKLGDAVLAQQKDVMDSVQRLRAKAKEAGQLKTTQEQKVSVEPATQIIIIEPAKPEVIYVPTYNPTVVYGAWPYPAYPPYYYYPPGYVAGTAAFSFAAGVAVGAAWGYAWGNCNWGHSDIDIDIDKNININQNINRSNYKNQMSTQSNAATRQAGQAGQTAGKGTWQHDPSSRKGVSYRDPATAQRYQGATQMDTRSREQFSGFAEKGRQDINRAGTQQPSARTSGAQTSASTRQGSQSKSTSSAFEGYTKGADVKQQSTRGQTSRQSSPSVQSRGSAPTRSSSGASRGGSRGGGGRR